MIRLKPKRLLIIDTFVGSGLIMVFIIRAFLAVTGYPQIGGIGLHIAHMLWGGFLMATMILYLLISKKPRKLISASIAGAGFGLFVDEIGKFITSDNNYFFQPAALLIYLIFLFIWIVGRLLISKADNLRFIPRASWPTNKWIKRFIIIWTFVQILLGSLAIIILVLALCYQVDIISKIPIIYILIYLIYLFMLILAIFFLLIKKTHLSVKTLRTATMLSIVAIYPMIFYYQQFTAVTGFLLSVAVLVSLTSKDDLLD